MLPVERSPRRRTSHVGEPNPEPIEKEDLVARYSIRVPQPTPDGACSRRLRRWFEGRRRGSARLLRYRPAASRTGRDLAGVLLRSHHLVVKDQPAVEPHRCHGQLQKRRAGTLTGSSLSRRHPGGRRLRAERRGLAGTVLPSVGQPSQVVMVAGRRPRSIRQVLRHPTSRR